MAEPRSQELALLAEEAVAEAKKYERRDPQSALSLGVIASVYKAAAVICEDIEELRAAMNGGPDADDAS